MTIEVRQLLIRSQVGVRPPAPAPAAGVAELERLRAQLLAEIKAYLREQQNTARER